MKSSNPRHFFESNAQQSRRQRRDAKSKNALGNPIALKSKIAAACLDPQSPSNTIYTAESTGSVRRVNVDHYDDKTVYHGPSAPMTCVVVGGHLQKTVFAGSWDKAIWSWAAETRRNGPKFVGHGDFVKAVACTKIGAQHLLISGGADKKVMVWDIATGARLHVLQDSVTNMLAVQSLVVDPEMSSDDDSVVFSASSDPHIRRWKIRFDGWEQLVDTAAGSQKVGRRTISVHEASIYKLVLDRAGGDETELWTASADGSTQRLSPAKGFVNDGRFEHGDHVRAVSVTNRWVITAGRDEELKVWERASAKLYCSLYGHFDEVTDLVLLESGHGHQERLVSVSIDGTVRTWPLDKAGLDAAVQEQIKAAAAIRGGGEKPDEAVDSILTAEEEAELAELMGDE